jgi:hypothetical protein
MMKMQGYRIETDYEVETDGKIRKVIAYCEVRDEDCDGENGELQWLAEEQGEAQSNCLPLGQLKKEAASIAEGKVRRYLKQRERDMDDLHNFND